MVKNYLQKFYKRNTNLSEITTNKNIIYKSSLRFIELGKKDYCKGRGMSWGKYIL